MQRPLTLARTGRLTASTAKRATPRNSAPSAQGAASPWWSNLSPGSTRHPQPPRFSLPPPQLRSGTWGQVFHPTCFICTVCGKGLDEYGRKQMFQGRDGMPCCRYCLDDQRHDAALAQTQQAQRSPPSRGPSTQGQRAVDVTVNPEWAALEQARKEALQERRALELKYKGLL